MNPVERVKTKLNSDLEYHRDKIDDILNQFRDDNGAINSRDLVNKIFDWEFKNLTYHQTMFDGLQVMYGVVTGDDWKGDEPDQLALKNWLKYKKKSYHQLIMRDPKESTSGVSNLVDQYRRKAFKKLYKTLKNELNMYFKNVGE